MKIILINPPVIIEEARKSVAPVIDNLFYNSPPLGLAYLAAVLEREGSSVAIIDAAVERLSLEEVSLRVWDFTPDWIGITSTTNLFDSAIKVAQKLKSVRGNIPVVLGGPHVSINPAEAIRFGCFDVGVIGEGEITVLELNRAFQESGNLDKIPGLVFQKDGKIIMTAPRETIRDLDTLPFPARHLLPLHLYRPQPNDQYVLPKMTMIAGRGCPYQCIFCDKSVFDNTYRSFSPGYIVSEMEHLVKVYGARDIAFLDSIFTITAERVEAIVEEIRRRKLNVHWTCTARANIVTEQLLKRMKDAGCWRIRLGIESGNDNVLAFIRKAITTRQVRNAATWAHQSGIQTKGFFMIGHLVDTRETIEETIRFALSLPLKDITVQINTPMIRTPQRQMCEQYGRFVTKDEDKFNYWEPVFVPNGLSEEYLREAYARFYRSFYCRPVIWWRHLRHIRDWRGVWRYFKAAALIKHLFFK